MSGSLYPWSAAAGSRFLFLLALLSGLTAAGTPGPAHAQEVAGQIRWRTDYNFARKEALDKKLPILIDFYKVPCPPCEMLDANFFRDPTVAKLINERFIPIRILGTDPANSQLTEVLGVDRFPTLVLAAHDGKVFAPGAIVGYREPSFLYDQLLRVVSSTSEPDWMVKSQQQANKYFQDKDYARAIGLLFAIVEDGKTKPVQLSARKMLQQLEEMGQARLAQAREMIKNQQHKEAIEAANEVIRNFPRLQAASDASRIQAEVMQQNVELRVQQRNKKAHELLAQAQEAYKNKDYFVCFDRCETLAKHYSDLPEFQEAFPISVSLKSDPQWLRTASDVMEERLGDVWITLGENAFRSGQPVEARYWFDRILRAFPNTRHAAHAQIRLNQIVGNNAQGSPAMIRFPGTP